MDRDPGFLERIHQGLSGHFSTNWAQIWYSGVLKGAELDDLTGWDLGYYGPMVRDSGFL